jgi:hypothetical protein
MHLRAPKARPSVHLECCSVANALVRAMTYRMYGAFIASLSAVALMLAANETFARGGFSSTHSFSHRPIGPSFRHHRRNNAGAFWPGVGDSSYGPSSGEPVAGAPPSASGDIHTTYTYDVPWDWAHRFPPNVTPSDRPYVSSCPAETVTVPGSGGEEQTVRITRCY